MADTRFHGSLPKRELGLLQTNFNRLCPENFFLKFHLTVKPSESRCIIIICTQGEVKGNHGKYLTRTASLEQPPLLPPHVGWL